METMESISTSPAPVPAPTPNSHLKARTKRPSIKPSSSASSTSNDLFTNGKPENKLSDRPIFSLPTPDQSPNLSQDESDGDGDISPLDSGSRTGTPNKTVVPESRSSWSGTESPAIEDYDDLTISPDAIVQWDENGDDQRHSMAGKPAAFSLSVTVDTQPLSSGSGSDEDAAVSAEGKGNGKWKKESGQGGSKQIRPTITVGTSPSTTDIHNSLLTAIEKQCQRIEEMSSPTSESSSSPTLVTTASTGHQATSRRSKRRGKFSDLVFTRKFSTFDRQNSLAATSPFHGFFTLFWIAISLFVIKIGAENWRLYGNPLGRNEILKIMLHRDLMVLLIADGVMCFSTGFSWILQRFFVRRGLVDWDREGWVLQHIWQCLFVAGVVGFPLVRDWPWTHTVFFVMHGMVMLMKMHSYAFYNGYLASVWKKRQLLLGKLKELEHVKVVTRHDPNRSWTEPFPLLPRDLSTEHLSRVPSAQEYKERRRMSIAAAQQQGADGSQENPEDDVDKIVAAIDSREPLNEEQVHVFERALKWEVDAMTDELRGKATDDKRVYPNNLTLANHYEFIVLPTLVYELEYPRSESINWYYAAEKMVACFGVIFVMIMISQAFIYPVVMETVRMKEIGMPLSERFQYFPWMLADLIFPFMMEYLLSWYLIWETILNFVAEITKFADRSFYDAWWNCVSWDQFARDWNRPVHNFLLRHVYHSSISAMKVDKHTATLITFFLSACVHELVMWCIFKKLRGYLLFLQMFQLPLVSMSRSRWMRNRKTLGNVFFWLGIFTGPSILCSLYLIL
ncbi:MBOAT, membrane-bound O-acyltransferase family-domain-containing protein [Pseudoneurospora amorphoporcata]|uniref:MBOAT, membrane-bound O-acyltransferase family-domain-containing protein n=1 Tax=Pseudoneurospora amorphoporcata TaxID=241081 RepID=A0AAN6P5E4_9PEZI|nr:MBOAT, membrane-bound O-acyltransferase family-domain-containing protein [Pseudoneurospora amorphoporcata]